MTQFRFHTQPLDFQLEVLQRSCDMAQFAVFWDMGLGKTKLIIDQAVYLYDQSKINAVLVVAPNGIHANWNMPGEGIQKHLLPELLTTSHQMTWHSKHSKHKSTAARVQKLFASKFPWLFMAFDAFVTKDGIAIAERFLKERRVLFVLDESTRVKTPGAQRTKTLKRMRLLTPWRRILTGTPAEQSPFDVYSQIDWLLPTYWREQGLGGFIPFKHFLADFRKQRAPQGHEFEVQLRDRDGRPIYKNLDQLDKMLRPVSSRLLKSEKLNLPEKIRQRVYYDLEPAQLKLYQQMEQDFSIWLEQRVGAMEELRRLREDYGEDSDEVQDFLGDKNSGIALSSADIAIVRQLRLHQLALGYVTDDLGNILHVADPNPALELLSELVEDIPHSGIVFCRFRKDVELVMGLLGERAYRMDGSVKHEDRVEAVRGFQAGERPWIVGTVAVMSEGWTLTRAQTVIYYSNDRKLGKRRQSEDRAMRIGQKNNVHYLDMMARGTISEDILDMLLYGEEITAAALGDRIKRKWIAPRG